MIRAFRIVKSEDLGKLIRLALARDGIEDPKSNTVILDDDDLPSGTKNVNYNFDGRKRPKVIVNGVDMFLKAFSDNPKYTVTPADIVNGMTMWSTQVDMCNHKNISEITKQYSVCQDTDNQLTIEVAWE